MKPTPEARAILADYQERARKMARGVMESSKQFQSLPEKRKLAELRKMDVAILQASRIAVLGIDRKITAKVEIVLDLMDPFK